MTWSPLNPWTWPQDTLRVPDGQGGMPPINVVNANQVRSEYFCLSAEFTLTPALAAHTTQSTILDTPQDGDFWVDQIAVVSWLSDPGGEGVTKDIQSFLASMITIRDNRTNRSLIYNPPFNTFNNQGQLFPADAVPINLFRKLPQSGAENSVAYDGSTPAPSGFRATQDLIQPYCFTRQGGISVSLTTLFAVPAGFTYDISIGFSGWKEYANASR